MHYFQKNLSGTFGNILVIFLHERACLVRALMCQAVLWGIKNGRRATKILMDDFFSIPLHLAKIFFVQVAHLVIF